MQNSAHQSADSAPTNLCLVVYLKRSTFSCLLKAVQISDADAGLLTLCSKCRLAKQQWSSQNCSSCSRTHHLVVSVLAKGANTVRRPF